MESYPDSKGDYPQYLPTGDRSYAILGTGALGGYYEACLQRAGLDVHFFLKVGSRESGMENTTLELTQILV